MALTPTSADAAVVPLDRSAWEAEVRRFADYSYRQSWAYGTRLAERRGAVSEHLAIRRSGQIVALADVRIKRLPLIGGGLAFVSGGPLVRLGDGLDGDLDRLDTALRALVADLVHRRGLTLRIHSPVGTAEENERVAAALQRAGLRRSELAPAYRTVLLDVERPLDEIRPSLHRHWRRQLNNAERRDLEMTFGTEPERFEEIARMSDALKVRKGYELDLDARFYAEVQQGLEERDRLVAGLVLKDGVPVAGNLTALHGDTAVYLVGASTEDGLESRAGYLMHWRTIELVRERGLPWYDLGGIDDVANPGVASFKLRTNGLDVTAPGPFELAPAGLRGRAAGWAEAGYQRLKGRRVDRAAAPST